MCVRVYVYTGPRPEHVHQSSAGKRYERYARAPICPPPHVVRHGARRFSDPQQMARRVARPDLTDLPTDRLHPTHLDPDAGLFVPRLRPMDFVCRPPASVLPVT